MVAWLHIDLAVSGAENRNNDRYELSRIIFEAHHGVELEHARQSQSGPLEVQKRRRLEWIRHRQMAPWAAFALSI